MQNWSEDRETDEAEHDEQRENGENFTFEKGERKRHGKGASQT